MGASVARSFGSLGRVSVSMGAVGALDLACQVGHWHELLGARRKVAKADLARRQLVADDDGEMSLVTRGGLELFAELSAAELGTRRDPRRAQVGRDSQPCSRVIGVGSDDDRDEGRFRRHLAARLDEREDEPVDADAEPDSGSGPSAEELHEAVVASAAADRLLLALAPGDVELER